MIFDGFYDRSPLNHSTPLFGRIFLELFPNILNKIQVKFNVKREMDFTTPKKHPLDTILRVGMVNYSTISRKKRWGTLETWPLCLCFPKYPMIPTSVRQHFVGFTHYQQYSSNLQTLKTKTNTRQMFGCLHQETTDLLIPLKGSNKKWRNN